MYDDDDHSLVQDCWVACMWLTYGDDWADDPPPWITETMRLRSPSPVMITPTVDTPSSTS